METKKLKCKSWCKDCNAFDWSTCEKKYIKKPKMEDYGYQDGGIEEESGWMLEGGEDAYFKALKEFETL